jgi:hypothetical protein
MKDSAKQYVLDVLRSLALDLHTRKGSYPHERTVLQEVLEGADDRPKGMFMRLAIQVVLDKIAYPAQLTWISKAGARVCIDDQKTSAACVEGTRLFVRLRPDETFAFVEVPVDVVASGQELVVQFCGPPLSTVRRNAETAPSAPPRQKTIGERGGQDLP